MRVQWSESAARDFTAAMGYLRAKSPSGARRVGERIMAAARLLEQFPEMAPVSRHRSLRQLAVPKTPYLMIYSVGEDVVEIRAVIHASQRRRR